MTLPGNKRAAGEGTSARVRLTSLRAGLATLAVAAAASFLVIRGGSDEAETGAASLGQALMVEGDYARAADTLRAAFRIAPTEETKIALARAMLGSGDFAGVLELLGETAEAESAPAFGYLRTEALLRAQRYDDAQAAAAEILAERPADGRSMLVTARALYGLGDAAGAEDFLGKALRARDGALGESWLFRARMALDANDLEAAQGAVARAAEAGAPVRSTALLASEALMRSGDFAGARDALPAPLQTRKRKGAPSVDIGLEYAAARIDAAAGDYVAAVRRIRAFKAALAGEPGAALVIGMIHEGAGDGAQAEAQYRQALAMAPNDAALLDALAAMLVRGKRYDEAERIVARLEKAEPSLGAMRRITLLAALSDNDGVLAAAKRAGTPNIMTASSIALGDESKAAQRDARDLGLARALAGAARALEEGGDSEMTEAARALASLEKNPAALTLAGELRLAMNDERSAAASFDRSLALAPAFQAALEGRVRVYVREGDFANAQGRLFSILATDTDNYAARVALARLLRLEGRRLEAAAVLSPAADRVVDRPRDALLYADLLASIGAASEIDALARAARRQRESAGLAAEMFVLAGRIEEAAGAARDALLASPGDHERAENYARLMTELDRKPEAVAFLSALVERRRGSAGSEAALARLTGGDGGREELRDGAPAGLGEAKRAYLRDPADPVAASRFGTALLVSGAKEEGARLLREACFLRSEGECRTPIWPRS